MMAKTYYEAASPGWEIHETLTIMDGLVVRWTMKGERELNGLQISASRNGVMIHGCMNLAVKSVSSIVSVLLEAERRARILS